MGKIPLHTLKSFDEFYLDSTSTIPPRHKHQVVEAPISYFSILLRSEHPCKDEIDVNRSDFYKVLLITKGSGILIYGTEKYDIGPNTILFFKPSEVKSWKALTKEQEGYYLIFTEKFYT